MKKMINVACVCMVFFSTVEVFSQKTINRQYQSWFSMNTTIRLKGKLGMLADVHIRRNNFMADPGFYFVRAAVNYWYADNLTFAIGYGHMWVAPTIPGYKMYADENRIYEQLQFISKIGKIGLTQRIRNEQRWQEIIISDVGTGENKFTDRIRYLLSATIPVSKNVKSTSWVLADEVCLQFGKQVVYNTFDQNRIFIGIKQVISKTLSFDIGYMYVTQQKSSGYQYDENETFRLFFYYTPDFRKKI